MSILKRQAKSSSDFLSFFSFITYNSFVSLQLIHFLLWAKGSHENTNFDKFLMSFSKAQVSFSSKYFAQKGPKCKCFRLFIAEIKIHQSLVIFETKNKVSSNFAQFFGVIRHSYSILFFQLKLYILSAILVKFHLSSRKSEIFHCGGFLL